MSEGTPGSNEAYSVRIDKLAAELLERKGIENLDDERKTVIDVIKEIKDRFEKISEFSTVPAEEELLTAISDTLDEAHGNFNGIFGENTLSFEDLIEELKGKIDISFVEPLQYSSDVGNGLQVEDTRKEIDELPDTIAGAINAKEAAQGAIEYIADGNHLGVSSEMYEEDLAEQGKDHDLTMKYLLSIIAEGKSLPPVFVAKYSKAGEKFEDEKIKKVILDGTHRMYASAVTNSKQAVIEVDVDKILTEKT